MKDNLKEQSWGNTLKVRWQQCPPSLMPPFYVLLLSQESLEYCKMFGGRLTKIILGQMGCFLSKDKDLGRAQSGFSAWAAATVALVNRRLWKHLRSCSRHSLCHRLRNKRGVSSQKLVRNQCYGAETHVVMKVFDAHKPAVCRQRKHSWYQYESVSKWTGSSPSSTDYRQA